MNGSPSTIWPPVSAIDRLPSWPLLARLLEAGWLEESNPGRDVHSVACCHYTMTTVFSTSAFVRRASPRTLRNKKPRSPSPGFGAVCARETVHITRILSTDRC